MLELKRKILINIVHNIAWAITYVSIYKSVEPIPKILILAG